MVDRLTKFLKKCNKKIRLRVQELIDQILAGNFKHLDIRKLENAPHLYRVRKGRIRIIFEHKNKIIVLKKVDYRDDQTYSDL